MCIDIIETYLNSSNETVIPFSVLSSDDELPRIAIVTITRNRHVFYDLMIRNMKTCDYPRTLITWIVVEDGEYKFDAHYRNENKIEGITFVYRNLSTLNFPIGYKRNIGARLGFQEHKVQYVVHMDDDDYYPEMSVLARVRSLMKYKNNDKHCVGTSCVRTFHLFSEITLCARDINDVNMSESTLAYDETFWNERRFDNHTSRGEGVAFIKDRFHQCLDIPTEFVITQFDHHLNTVQRRITNTVIYGMSFLDTVNTETRSFIISLRDTIVHNMPETRHIVDFIRIHGSTSQASKHVDSLSMHVQRHPLTVELRRQYSYNDSLIKEPPTSIAFYCATGQHMSFDRVWDYTRTDNIGGSEESVLLLASVFVSKGYPVFIYNERTTIDVIHGVTFVPWYMCRPLNKRRMVIVWRDPSNLSLKWSGASCVLLDLHDAIPTSWIRTSYTSCLNYIFVKSRFHMNHVVPENYRSLCKIVPNGICTLEYPRTLKLQRLKRVKNNDNIQTILCTSSPERCWIDLFRLVDDIVQVKPHVHFVHAYSTQSVKLSPVWPVLQKAFDSVVYKDHLVLHDHVDLKDMISLYTSADIFVYPTRFPEIDCMSLTKALACNCMCVHTSAGAMKEKTCYGTECIPCSDTPLSTDGTFRLSDEEYTCFLNAVLTCLEKNEISCEHVDTVLEIYDINKIANTFLNTMLHEIKTQSKKNIGIRKI